METPPLDPAGDDLSRCIQCGLCLPACPTYALTPREIANPRGRITLMRAVAEGQLAIDDPAFSEAMYYCTGCLACETACPAGVAFGTLIERARDAAERAAAPGRPGSRTRRLLLDRLLPYPRRLRLAARALRLYQRSLARAPGWRRWLTRRYPRLAALEPLAPEIPPQSRRWRIPHVIDPAGVMTNGYAPQLRGVVALHPGCVQEVALPGVNADTAQVLAYNAWRVVVPKGFVCCGALHAHHGRPERARALARHNIDVLERSEADTMVSNAAGCGAFFKQYGNLLADDPEWADRARRFSSGVVDVCEHLVESGLRRPKRPFHIRVTYADPCHLVHGQRIADAPRLLLRAIPGLELIQLPESTWCCGSAGIYNVTHPGPATELLERKLTHIAETGAELVLTGNPGCMLQIARGLTAAGSPVRVLHPVALLRAAYQLTPLIPR